MKDAPSKHQIAFETVMFNGTYPNEYERLRALAKAYRGSKLTKQWFVHGIFWMFADDGGMDWADDFKSLNHLAKIICDNPSGHKLPEPKPHPSKAVQS